MSINKNNIYIYIYWKIISTYGDYSTITKNLLVELTRTHIKIIFNICYFIYLFIFIQDRNSTLT